MNTGRRFIGMEKLPEYFDIAYRRIEDAQRMGDMFLTSETKKPIQNELI